MIVFSEFFLRCGELSSNSVVIRVELGCSLEHLDCKLVLATILVKCLTVGRVRLEASTNARLKPPLQRVTLCIRTLAKAGSILIAISKSANAFLNSPSLTNARAPKADKVSFPETHTWMNTYDSSSVLGFGHLHSQALPSCAVRQLQ